MATEAATPAEALGSQDLAQVSEEDEPALWATDAFRMHAMKVLPCSKRYVHDWTECPFAHPQEKARRRDPRHFTYTGIACPSMKKEGTCAFGDHCPYAHNVFEYWLHPTRYRTQLCNDGSNCKRKICFFAHSLDELRVPACKPFVSPEALAAAAATAAADAEAKRKSGTFGEPTGLRIATGGPSAAELISTPVAAAAAVAMPASPHAPMGAAAAAGGAHGQAESLSASLQQLQGRGFSQQEQNVIELVTSMLSQEKISAAQAASILQAMLPVNTIALLQSTLLAPATPLGGSDAGTAVRANSDPLDASRVASLDAANEAALMGMVRSSLPVAGAASVYQAMMAPQGQGLSGVPAAQYGSTMAPYPGASPRASYDASSMRSSFDTMRADPMDYGSTRGSMDVRSASIDYSRATSLDYSRAGSIDMASYPAQQAAMQSAFYQQQQQRGASSVQPLRLSGGSQSGRAGLQPVPEHGQAAPHPLPPSSQAIAQVAASASAGDLTALALEATAQAAALARAAPATPALQPPQQPRRHSADPYGVVAAAAALAAEQRRLSADTAWQQAQQAADSGQGMELPYAMLNALPEGVAYLPARSSAPVAWTAQQLAAAQQQMLAVQQAQQQQQYGRGSPPMPGQDALAVLSQDFRRMSVEDAERSMGSVSVERRPAPVMANAYSSSLFASSAPGLAAPSPTRMVQQVPLPRTGSNPEVSP